MVIVTIREALASDIEPSVDALMAGFSSDPVLVWLVPDDRTRRRFLRGLFSATFEDSHRSGELRVAEDDGEVCGVAVWYPPGGVRNPTGPAMNDALAALDDGDLDRLRALGEATKDHAPSEPHFYLWLMAVAPEKRGAGIGGAFLTSVLDICDESQTFAFLEATRPENRRLYERYGFEVTGEIRLPGGLAKWPMTRPPQT
jgi:GNAT superfamily N-acetyltransferase